MTNFTENVEGLPETADEAVDFIGDGINNGGGIREDVFDFMPEGEIEDFIDDMEHSLGSELILRNFYDFDDINNEFFQAKYEEVRRRLLGKYIGHVIHGLNLLYDVTNGIYEMEDYLQRLKMAVCSLEGKIKNRMEVAMHVPEFGERLRDGVLPTTAKWAAKYIRNFCPGCVPGNVLHGLPIDELREFRTKIREYFDPEDALNYLDDLCRVWEEDGNKELGFINIRYELVGYLALSGTEYFPKNITDRLICRSVLESALRAVEKEGKDTLAANLIKRRLEELVYNR